MRRALFCWTCLVVVMNACVLPDYKVEEATTAVPENAVSITGAPDACRACSVQQCDSERTACGENCDGFSWPISPAWNVNDTASPYVECLAARCEADCQVSWGCVGNYSIPTANASYTATITVVDGLTNTPMSDVVVYACQGVDPSCEGPGRVGRAVSDSAGQVRLQLSPTFFGYFLADPSRVSEKTSFNYLPTTVSPSQPIYRISQQVEMIILTRELVAAIGQQIQINALNAEAGHIASRALSCMPARYAQATDGSLGLAAATHALASASGVTVAYQSQSSAGSPVYYLNQSQAVDPSATATLPGAGGISGAVNVPPGQTTLIAQVGAQQVSTTTLTVTAESVAFAILVPDQTR